ncbi:hypothetical protein MRX96_028138 [Rhipicephalus microplus]
MGWRGCEYHGCSAPSSRSSGRLEHLPVTFRRVCSSVVGPRQRFTGAAVRASILRWLETFSPCPNELCAMTILVPDFGWVA